MISVFHCDNINCARLNLMAVIYWEGEHPRCPKCQLPLYHLPGHRLIEPWEADELEKARLQRGMLRDRWCDLANVPNWEYAKAVTRGMSLSMVAKLCAAHAIDINRIVTYRPELQISEPKKPAWQY